MKCLIVPWNSVEIGRPPRALGQEGIPSPLHTPGTPEQLHLIVQGKPMGDLEKKKKEG
jgi:hypothetical protein